MKKLCLLIIISLVLSSFLKTHVLGQAIPPTVNQQKVLAAIDKGRRFLRAFLKTYPDPSYLYPSIYEKCVSESADELVLFTLIHIDADQNSNEFKMLLKRVLDNSDKLQKTYRVALLAMALAALDNQKYQHKIAWCAQFLVDQQCKNGQWNYPTPSIPMKELPEFISESTSSESKPGETRSLRVIKIKRRGKGPATGDNSNMQYALLGLRACMEANVIIPQSTFQSAEKWLRKSQCKDGGWNYQKGGKGYGSMTAGGLGALVICKYYLGKNYESNSAVRRALKWLDKNFSIEENPKSSIWWHYYYLYALERAGMLYGTETFGKHDWYKEGAEYLIKNQTPNGYWFPHGEKGYCREIVETCFALLFLRRATKPIISGTSK